MLLRIVYYFVLSILAVGIYHSVHEWVQEQMAFYFQVSKVKKTDKIFELVESIGTTMEKDEQLLSSKLENENKEVEKGAVEFIDEREDLFQFIDGL